MENKIKTFIKRQLIRVHVLIKGTVSARYVKKHMKNYIHAVTPPYSRKDVPHLLGTLVILVIVFSLSLVLSNFSIKRIFASNPDTTPPTQPQILVGVEHPLHIPYTHAEQGSVHIYWLPSTDTTAIAGYRIYRNERKIGETTGTSFDDSGVSGKVTYIVEAYDLAGNTSKSTLHLVLPSHWASASSADAILSGFVLNKTDNSPIENTTITLDGGKTIHTTQNGYYYLIFSNGNDGQMQVKLNANGYMPTAEQIMLKKGQSTNQIIYLIPQTNKTNGLLKFIQKLL